MPMTRRSHLGSGRKKSPASSVICSPLLQVLVSRDLASNETVAASQFFGTDLPSPSVRPCSGYANPRQERTELTISFTEEIGGYIQSICQPCSPWKCPFEYAELESISFTREESEIAYRALQGSGRRAGPLRS